MRNISLKFADKIKTQELKTATCFFFFSENRAIYEIKNTVEPDRPQQTQNMRVARCITKPTIIFQLCNNYCFSTVAMLKRKRLYVTLQAHRLGYFKSESVAMFVIVITA